MTLHAYSPPLWRMGSYEVLPTGELRRWSLSFRKSCARSAPDAEKKKRARSPEASTWEGEEGRKRIWSERALSPVIAGRRPSEP